MQLPSLTKSSIRASSTWSSARGKLWIFGRLRHGAGDRQYGGTHDDMFEVAE
jgi:hypothetical protein